MTTQSIYSPFKDYFSTTEKKIFHFKDTKFTTPATVNTLNEVIDNVTNSNYDKNSGFPSQIDKTLQEECGIGGRDSRIVGGTESGIRIF